jgi:hypothetical protein
MEKWPDRDSKQDGEKANIDRPPACLQMQEPEEGTRSPPTDDKQQQQQQSPQHIVLFLLQQLRIIFFLSCMKSQNIPTSTIIITKIHFCCCTH